MDALRTEVAGMVAENDQRKAVGESMAYTDDYFRPIADKFRKIREDLIGYQTILAEHCPKRG